ncbi:MAG: DUF3293 domain-containing protein [Betaproteobacteria bacterium]
MSIPNELRQAYENADYAVFFEPELVLRIGEPGERLERLMEFMHVRTAAFVTAWNPGSRRRPGAENAAAAEALEGLVDAAGYPRYRAEGRDPERSHPPEPSLLILGIYRENAEALGRLFGQNAIVFVEQGRAPELLYLL